jgi:superfamily II DNA or RNA helicase
MEAPKKRVLKKSKKPKNEIKINLPMETFTEPNMIINTVEPDKVVENVVQNIMIPNQTALNKNMLATLNNNMKMNDGELLAKKMNTFIEDAPIEPLFWVLPNKKSFPQWVTETFVKYRANGKLPTKPKNGKVKPFKYQLMLRDYMQNASPYRGILLFHELGAGKTLTTLYICENLKTERNIVVMLPASLKPNFIKELVKINPLYKNNPNAIKEKYTFVSYNASNTLAQLKKLGSLDNKVIVIEEAHNLVSKMVSGMSGISVQGMEIYKMLMSAQNAKIIALTGTPIINDPFEFAVLCNVLRGNIEITNFRIMEVDPKFGETWDFIELEKTLASIPYVDYLEINKVNKSMSFHIMVKSYSNEYVQTIEEIIRTARNEGVELKKMAEVDNYPLFPTDDYGERFYNYFVHEDPEKGDKMKESMIPIFKNRILGLISYYKPLLTNYPELVVRDVYRVNMSNYQYQIYEILRDIERRMERSSVKSSSKRGKKEKTKSTFRVFSRQASNFVFPEEINRPYPDPNFIISLKKKKMMNNGNDDKLMMIAQKIDEQDEGKLTLAQDYQNRIAKALDELTEGGEVYLKPGPNGLDKLSPKMRVLLENIKNCPGLIFIYSNFRSLEGIEILTKVLDFNGYAKYGTPGNEALPRYTIYSGTEDDKQKTEILQMFTADDNKYGEKCKILMATSAGAEGLDLKNIRQIHIMEPYWNQMRIQQVIGRGYRRNSHIALPENERKVEIYRYFCVTPPNVASREALSTDEKIEEISIKKQGIIDELKLMMKECAFDCILNAPDVQGDYRCYSFGEGANGISYFPQLNKNVTKVSRTRNTKTVRKSYVPIVFFDKKVYRIDMKAKKMYEILDTNKILIDLPKKEDKKKYFYLNPETNEIYDYKSVEDKNPIKVGHLSDKGKIIIKK